MLNSAKITFERVQRGRPAKSFIAVGLRGVGKTVILNEVQQIAEAKMLQSIYIEAYDEIKLPNALAKALRPVLLRLSKKDAMNALSARALGARHKISALIINCILLISLTNQ